jgi:hypothetical protein
MANVTYTVPNKSGSYDGDMVVKQYTYIEMVQVILRTTGLIGSIQNINGTLGTN